MARDVFPVVVHVLMLRGEELFLLRRANSGFMDGYYALPGGHQQAGESVEAAAKRECAEETGVHGAVLSPVCVMPYRFGRHQGLNFVFEALEWQGEPRIAEPELFSESVWVSPRAMPEPHATWISDVLRCR
ncbi:MAG: NUDIX domain-containing protein, partial [Pseudomonadales bacterium]